MLNVCTGRATSLLCCASARPDGRDSIAPPAHSKDARATESADMGCATRQRDIAAVQPDGHLSTTVLFLMVGFVQMIWTVVMVAVT